MNNSISKKAHFIGIGGIGMSGIARLFLSKGIQVSGSDLKKVELPMSLMIWEPVFLLGIILRTFKMQIQ